MPSSLTTNIGPYLCYPETIMEKKFDNDRTFKIAISAAYNAGIIGYEYNGIVIFDEDNRKVVLDLHMQQQSGYYGPSDNQIKELARIMNLDWKPFTSFCKENSHFRGGSPEDFSDIPTHGNPLNRAIANNRPLGQEGPSILTSDMQKANLDPECSYKFPYTTREDIIVFLANHHGHVPANYNNGGFCLAWDIKLHGNVDMTGSAYGTFEVEAEYSEQWSSHVEREGERIVDMACRDAVDHYTSGEYCPFPGPDEGYKFATAGRSGGHLILTQWDGPSPSSGGWRSCPMAFSSRNDFIEWLQDLSDKDLSKLYALTVSVDQDTKNPHMIISNAIADARINFTCDLKDEQKQEDENQFSI